MAAWALVLQFIDGTVAVNALLSVLCRLPYSTITTEIYVAKGQVSGPRSISMEVWIGQGQVAAGGDQALCNFVVGQIVVARFDE
jgi:hypothetical protein